jgi:hypothetical protein
MTPPITIIILNWNNAPDTIACVQSLKQSSDLAPSLLVVDNGSTDDSVEAIQNYDPSITVLKTGANLGYAGGNNAGIRQALSEGAELICILNNDITVEPGFLLPLMEAICKNPDVGLATPLVVEDVENGQVWALGSIINRRTGVVKRQHAGEPIDIWRNKEPIDVDIASGAAMLVRREVFERVEALDESFFLYYEEVDWCLKLRQAGFCILAVPSSVVWHKVSASLGSSSPVIDYYMLRNNLRLILRHWSGALRVIVFTRIVARNLATILAYTVKSHRGARIRNRNARLLALRDVLLRRWGKMGSDVKQACQTQP